MDQPAQKDALLGALLPDVPFDGWTMEAMRAAARRIGLEDGALATLFPGGPRDLVAWFSHWADRLTLETVAAQPNAGAATSERIGLGVRTRLRLLMPHREAVRRGLSLLAMPAHAPLGLRLLYDTVDAIWFAAGDTATDFSFYTKRGMLAGIYAATTLYWLDDRSADGSATDAFLARRLADASLILPRLKARVGRVAGLLPNPARFFRLARPDSNPPRSKRPYPAGLTSGSSGTAFVCASRKASSAAATVGSESARIAAARIAALTAPARPIASVPTGTPPGIWTIEKRLSNPMSAPLCGTPSTGKGVSAASTPGSPAANPAPAISTLSPRPRAPLP